MPDLYLLDPPPDAAWMPFCDARPVCEMRAGAWLIRERWEAIAESETRGIFTAAHLLGFVEDGAPSPRDRGEVAGPAVVGLSNFAPSGIVPEWPDGPARLVNDGATVGWWVPAGHSWDGDDGDGAGWGETELEGVLLRGAYDLLTALELFLVADTADLTSEGGDDLPDGSTVIGDPHDLVLLGAHVEPGVTFDLRRGAVVIEQHAYVKAGTRLEGPAYVGPGTEILGGQISWSAFGPRCRVHGEVTHSVFFGYANKAHDGFLGHSVLGRWVNLGAGTVTSNLKNTYGPVRLDVAGTAIETERQFLGTLFGDHAKTAIGTLFNTGSVVGAGANVFGAVRPPKFVAPFAWGDSGGVLQRDGFVATAERAMPRRQVTFTDDIRTMLEALYDHAVTR